MSPREPNLQNIPIKSELGGEIRREWFRALESSKPPEVYGPRPFAVYLSDSGHPDDAAGKAYARARALGPTAHVRRRDIWDDQWGWVGYKYEVYP